MYINKYQQLTVRELRKILFDIKDQDSAIVSINFYDKDCQDVEGIDDKNEIVIIDSNEEDDYIKHIEIIQKEIES